MSNLILLNGPPGCGKSVLARRYLQDHPLALNLDIDRVRDLLGCWSDHLEPAGLLARELALDMARRQLRAGYEVVIPQYLGRPKFLHQLEELAAEVGVALREFLLFDTKQNSLRRWAAREALTGATAATGLSPNHGSELIAEMYDRLMVLVQSRPNVIVIHTKQGEIEAAYQALLERLSFTAG